jgi:Tol biopolymer transport system component
MAPSKLRLTVLLVTVILSAVACAAGQPTPTPTAIPLLATARPTAKPTHQAPAEEPPARTPTQEAAIETPVTGTSIALPELDDLLARRTVDDFLTRLVRREFASAASLYLSDGAREAGLDQAITDLASGEHTLIAATVVDFGPAPALSYEAQAELQWSGTGNGYPATQAMALRLALQRGLWLIDDILLGELEPADATPPPPAAQSSRRPPRVPALEGKLVFQARSGGDIYRINADGTGLRRLTDGLDPAWSPDGRHIAFTRWRNPWGVYLIDADGGGEQRIVDRERLKEVAWSPAGDRIAFTLNLGSSEPKEVCLPGGYCYTIPPMFSAQIWIAEVDSDGFLSLPLDDQSVHAPSWSPEGNRIVYAGPRGLAWIDLDSNETGDFVGSKAADGSPAYSPNGRQIAFMGRVHNRWEIFVMNADGSERRQITQSDPRLEQPPHNVAPAWSPDGSQIAFLSDRDGLWRIYVMDADSSKQRAMFADQLDGLGLSYEWASERVLSWTD